MIMKDNFLNKMTEIAEVNHALLLSDKWIGKNSEYLFNYN